MRKTENPILASTDIGLLRHWCNGLRLKTKDPIQVSSYEDLVTKIRRSEDIIWLDSNLPGLPNWGSHQLREMILLRRLRIIVASSNPTNADAIAALSAGCAGYCHAYSDSSTLIQIQQVAKIGHVWIGQNLMDQLIRAANAAAAGPALLKPQEWQSKLTAREREIAGLAANGASNLSIAETCSISERTVKAHMSAIFEKLGVSDRLQLALKVHGIQ